MPHNTNLTFGPLVTIIFTRDSTRRISKVESFFQGKPEGFILEIFPSQQEGIFRSILSNSVEEKYLKDTVYSRENQTETFSEEQTDFSAWLNKCMKRMVAWARSLAISLAHDAIATQDHKMALNIFRDVLDHYPPPPNSSLLYWLYYCCKRRLNNDDDETQDFLLLWFSEALEISGLEAVPLVLEPAKELLGLSKTVELSNEWLTTSSLQEPAYKRTKRWLLQLKHSPLWSVVWSNYSGKPFTSREASITNCPNGDVIVLGGLNSHGNPLKKASRWNIQEKRWESLPDMPFPRHRHTAVVMWDNSIIVIGGTIVVNDKLERFSDSTICYNPHKNTWETLSPLLIGRENLSSINFRGRIIIIGGESPSHSDSFVEVWDRRAKTWVRSASLDLQLEKVVLHNYHGEVLITGPSVSTSGCGALSFDPRKETLNSFDTLQKKSVDGLFPLQSDKLMIWNKQENGVKIGVWTPKKQTISWTTPDLAFSSPDDLLRVCSCEDDQFLLLHQTNDGNCRLYVLNPHDETVDALESLTEEHQLDFLNAIHLMDGRIMLTDHHNTFLLTI